MTKTTNRHTKSEQAQPNPSLRRSTRVTQAISKAPCAPQQVPPKGGEPKSRATQQLNLQKVVPQKSKKPTCKLATPASAKSNSSCKAVPRPQKQSKGPLRLKDATFGADAKKNPSMGLVRETRSKTSFLNQSGNPNSASPAPKKSVTASEISKMEARLNTSQSKPGPALTHQLPRE